MAEGRKSHLSQGGRGNGIQEREPFAHKVNCNVVCSGRVSPVSAGYLFAEETLWDQFKINGEKGFTGAIPDRL